jgi:hypothetical protein
MQPCDGLCTSSPSVTLPVTRSVTLRSPLDVVPLSSQDQQSDTVDGKINIKKLRSMYGILLPVLQRQRIPYDHKPVRRCFVG